MSETDDTERTADEHLGWVERELNEARRALWDGRPVKAFASVEAAQESLAAYQEAIGDE